MPICVHFSREFFCFLKRFLKKKITFPYFLLLCFALRVNGINLLWIHYGKSYAYAQLHVSLWVGGVESYFLRFSSRYSGTIIASKRFRKFEVNINGLIMKRSIGKLFTTCDVFLTNLVGILMQKTDVFTSHLLVCGVCGREKITSPLLLFYIMIFAQEFIINPRADSKAAAAAAEGQQQNYCKSWREKLLWCISKWCIVGAGWVFVEENLTY